MSGGHYDHAYHHVVDMAETMAREDARADVEVGGRVYDSTTRTLLTVEESAPILARVAAERAWFAGLLHVVADAMRAVEWVDSCDCGPGDEVKAIDAVRAYVRGGA